MKQAPLEIVSKYLSKRKFFDDCYAKKMVDWDEYRRASASTYGEAVSELTMNGMDMMEAIAYANEAFQLDAKGEAIL